MKRHFIVANWKMNPQTLPEAKGLWNDIASAFPDLHTAHIVMCPPTPYLVPLVEGNASLGLLVGAQDCSDQTEGAFTGEVSAQMLKNIGAQYLILGHSERRARGETDEIIAQKIKLALSVGLVPIVCIGETSREKHNYHEMVITQVESVAKTITDRDDFPIMIAYEPVWAISSQGNRPATPEEAGEMIDFIRSMFSRLLGPRGDTAVILYGGSVSSDDIQSFLLHGGFEGFLVGRASLSPETFIPIVEAVERS